MIKTIQTQVMILIFTFIIGFMDNRQSLMQDTGPLNNNTEQICFDKHDVACI